MILEKSNFQLTLQPTEGAFRKRNSSMVCNVQAIILQPSVIFSNNMQNNPNHSTTGIPASAMTTDARNALIQNIFYIDEVKINGDTVTIDYTLNDNWNVAVLSLQGLKKFALNMGMNDYCFDFMHGEHVQEAGSFDIDTFLAEKLDDVIKAYLEVDRIEQSFAGISMQIDVLKAKMNAQDKLLTLTA
jgi:hypothetical protein